MQTVSELYRSILNDRRHTKEVKAVIGGVEYGKDKIVSCSTSGGLFSDSTLSVGGCVSREIDLSLRNPGEIPRMAEIRLYVRLVLDDQASEWLPKGVFYIDTRSKTYDNVLSLHGYDAMMKAEQTWLTSEYDTEHWPMPMPDAVTDIAGRLGVAVDSRTVINPSYEVEYPVDYTIREALSYIAGAHAGNWYMTEEGKLRLVTLYELPPETNYLVTEHGDAITFGGVRILVG